MVDQRDPVLQDGSDHFQSSTASVVSQTDERRSWQVGADALADDEGVEPGRPHVEFREFRMTSMDAFMDQDEFLPHGAPFVKQNVIQK